MEPNVLPQDADGLIAMAEGVANAVAEKKIKDGRMIELRLRVRIAAATYERAAFRAVRGAAHRSAQARALLEVADRRWGRALDRLHEQLVVTIAALSVAESEMLPVSA
jgi:hypothetical protein